MKFLWWSDFHIADVPPVMRSATYKEDVFSKGYEIASLCEERGVDYSIFGGDFFNSKVSARISHSLVNEALRLLNAFPCEVLFLVGSHDIPYGRPDLAEKRPIGTLLQHPSVSFLNGARLLLPAVRLYAVSDSYNNTTEEVLAELAKQRDVTERALAELPKRRSHYYEVAVLHQPVVKEGTYPYEVIQASDLVGTADLILYGHMHNYEGIWDLTVNDKTTKFVNVGAIARGVLDEKTLSRTPTVVLFELDEHVLVSIEEIPLKSARPANEIFRMAEKQERLEREADIEALLVSVKETQFGMFSAHGAVEKIRALQYALRTDILPEDKEVSEAHFEAVKNAAIEILEELGA
jgi:DNA repair protein SbcD/Mre11